MELENTTTEQRPEFTEGIYRGHIQKIYDSTTEPKAIVFKMVLGREGGKQFIRNQYFNMTANKDAVRSVKEISLAKIKHFCLVLLGEEKTNEIKNTTQLNENLVNKPFWIKYEKQKFIGRDGKEVTTVNLPIGKFLEKYQENIQPRLRSTDTAKPSTKITPPPIEDVPDFPF